DGTSAPTVPEATAHEVPASPAFQPEEISPETDPLATSTPASPAHHDADTDEAPRAYGLRPELPTDADADDPVFHDLGPVNDRQRPIVLGNRVYHLGEHHRVHDLPARTTRSGTRFASAPNAGPSHILLATTQHEAIPAGVMSQQNDPSARHVYIDPGTRIREPRHEGELAYLSKDEQLIWKRATDEEMANFQDDHVLEPVDKSETRGVVMDMMKIYKLKAADEDGRRRAKVRFVVRGDQQKDVDEELSSPVVSPSSVRMQIVHALTHGHDFAIFDIRSAFLSSTVHDRDYFVRIRQDDGFAYFRLLRGAYGLPSAPARYHAEFTHAMSRAGLEPCPDDPCLFRHETSGLLVSTHVDDGLVTAPSEVIQDLKLSLESYFGADKVTFKSVEDGTRTRFLGAHLVVNRADKVASMDHADFIAELLDLTSMDKCSPLEHPGTSDDLPFPKDIDADELYQSLVGSLQWIVSTRPDCAFAVK
ncbi:Retrovirus-related Pol polyprotein from transposon TNT 1-94, partial [Hondaea fermentalgiana]